MNKNSSFSPQIKWNKFTPLQIIQNSRDILNYYAGKLQQEPQRRQVIDQLIQNLYPGQLSLYFTLLSHIQTWSVYWYFSPLYRQAPNLLNYLTHIKFNSLTKLVINQSNLYSIEQLPWLDCPFLKQIDIQENFITSLQPLAKTNFTEMIVLKFYYNSFIHGQNKWINRTKWNCFHELGLYHFCKDIFYDCYFKFQPNKLKKIYVEKAKGQTLNNEKVISKLQDKFIANQFFVHFARI